MNSCIIPFLLFKHLFDFVPKYLKIIKTNQNNVINKKSDRNG